MLKIACIPAYNAGNTIYDIVKRSKQFVDMVVVCNDGSNDNTVHEASKAGAVVISHEKNLGKGATLRSLFSYSIQINSDFIVTIDADGQFLPEEIPKIMELLIESSQDVIIGNRYSDSDEMPNYRKTGNKILDKISKLASDLPFNDTQSGFRGYSKNALKQIKFTSNGFGADSEILIDASQKNLKISEVDVKVLYDTAGETSTTNPISQTVDIITSLVEQVAIRHPLKYLGTSGLSLLILGSVLGVYVVSLFNETRYFSVPFTLLTLGSIIIGFILILMAVVLFSIVRTSKSHE
jgi:glycosyltransferase involved in cell wall biosynthesis